MKIRLRGSLSPKIVITAVSKDKIWFKYESDIICGNIFERFATRLSFESNIHFMNNCNTICK